MNLFEHDTLTLVLAAVVATLSVGRTARLLIHDTFPPVAWLRARIIGLYKDDSDWADLWDCPFCMAPWLMVGMVGWAEVSDLNGWWWLINAAWACSWLAAIVYAYDQQD